MLRRRSVNDTHVGAEQRRLSGQKTRIPFHLGRFTPCRRNPKTEVTAIWPTSDTVAALHSAVLNQRKHRDAAAIRFVAVAQEEATHSCRRLGHRREHRLRVLFRRPSEHPIQTAVSSKESAREMIIPDIPERKFRRDTVNLLVRIAIPAGRQSCERSCLFPHSLIRHSSQRRSSIQKVCMSLISEKGHRLRPSDALRPSKV
jgi:hypothetical protein